MKRFKHYIQTLDESRASQSFANAAQQVHAYTSQHISRKTKKDPTDLTRDEIRAFKQVLDLYRDKFKSTDDLYKAVADHYDIPVATLQYISTLTEALDPGEILGRNLAAKNRYKQLEQSNPQAAHEFLQQFKARTHDYQTLRQLIKTMITTHLSHTSQLNITSGSNYAVAMKNVSDAVRRQYPQLTHNQIARTLNKTNTDTEDSVSSLIDLLYPDLKGV